LAFLLHVEHDFKDHVKRYGTRQKLLEKQWAIVERRRKSCSQTLFVILKQNLFCTCKHEKAETEAF